MPFSKGNTLWKKSLEAKKENAEMKRHFLELVASVEKPEPIKSCGPARSYYYREVVACFIFLRVNGFLKEHSVETSRQVFEQIILDQPRGLYKSVFDLSNELKTLQFQQYRENCGGETRTTLSLVMIVLLQTIPFEEVALMGIVVRALLTNPVRYYFKLKKNYV